MPPARPPLPSALRHELVEALAHLLIADLDRRTSAANMRQDEDAPR
jgi:hypothetical protein